MSLVLFETTLRALLGGGLTLAGQNSAFAELFKALLVGFAVVVNLSLDSGVELDVAHFTQRE